MAEWPSDLGVATLTGRVLLMQGDQSDPDRVPDVRAAEGGTVEVEASVPAVRYSGADGTALFVKQVTRGVLDGQGRICTPAAGEDDPVPDLIVPAVDSPLLSPSDFTYRVRIKVGPWVTSYSIAPGTGEVIDLATATPVDSSGGTAIIVDTSTADRAEAAAAAAEATVAGIDQAIADAIASDPELRGPAGADSTVPGPPGAVPTAGDYLVAGPGRPDVPATTGLTAAALDELSVGAVYVSSDGAGVGAWRWTKRPTGWVVTDGDTGWITITAETDPEAEIYLRRINNSISWQFRDLGTAGSRVCAVPAWAKPELGPWMRIGAPLYRHGGQTGHIYFASGTGVSLAWPDYIWLTSTSNSDSASAGHMTYAVSHDWPATLTP